MGLGCITSLDYTVILCSRMDETRTFYEAVMGLTVVEDRENWVSFRVGAALLTLRPRGRSPVGDDGPRPRGSAAVQLAFKVPLENVERCHEDLLAHGVPILRGPTDLPHWHHRTLFFSDPEDNIIEIYADL